MTPPTAALPTHVLEWIDRHGLDRRAAKEMALAWEDAQTWRPDSAPAVQATADADELAREICARLFLMTPMAGTIATISEVIRKAVSPKAAASKDMVLVPRRATKEMCAAYALQVGYSRMPGDVWDAMISAAVSGDKQEKER